MADQVVAASSLVAGAVAEVELVAVVVAAVVVVAASQTGTSVATA